LIAVVIGAGGFGAPISIKAIYNAKKDCENNPEMLLLLFLQRCVFYYSIYWRLHRILPPQKHSISCYEERVIFI
jgi:hypothetical protein